MDTLNTVTKALMFDYITYTGRFKNIPVRLLGTRFGARYYICEPGPQEPYRDPVVQKKCKVMSVTDKFRDFSEQIFCACAAQVTWPLARICVKETSCHFIFKCV
jgi:hypothetical protein